MHSVFVYLDVREVQSRDTDGNSYESEMWWALKCGGMDSLSINSECRQGTVFQKCALETFTSSLRNSVLYRDSLWWEGSVWELGSCSKGTKGERDRQAPQWQYLKWQKARLSAVLVLCLQINSPAREMKWQTTSEAYSVPNWSLWTRPSRPNKWRDSHTLPNSRKNVVYIFLILLLIFPLIVFQN